MPFSSGGTSTVTGVTLGGAADNFALAVQDNAQQASSFVWVDPNCAAGQTAVSIAGANLLLGSGDGGVVIYEIAGLALTFAGLLDKTSHSNNSTGTSWTSIATPTTTSLNDIVIGCANAASPSSPAGYANTLVTGGFGIAGQKIVSSTGAFVYNGTQTSGVWSASIVALAAATSAVFTKNLALNQSVMRSAVW